MSDLRLRQIAAIGLVAGGLLGMAGTFTSSASWRGLAWGVDGTALVVAGALLTVHHFRRGNGLAAAGFLVFVAGETLILSGAAMALDASAPSFAASFRAHSSSKSPSECLWHWCQRLEGFGFMTRKVSHCRSTRRAS